MFRRSQPKKPKSEKVKKRLITRKVDPHAPKSLDEIYLIGSIYQCYFSSGVSEQSGIVVFYAHQQYKVTYVHPKHGRIEQSVRFLRDLHLTKPLHISAEDAHMHTNHLLSLSRIYSGRSGHPVRLKADRPYSYSVDHPEDSYKRLHLTFHFERDVLLNSGVIKIDPAKMRSNERKMLAKLLRAHPENNFFDTKQFATNDRDQVYLAPLKDYGDHVVYQQVQLIRPLVRFVAKKEHDNREQQFAVLERGPIGSGGEGDVYASAGTLTLNGDSVTYKEKNPEKMRVLKQLASSEDRGCDSNGDLRTQEEKASHEYGLTSLMPEFHLKHYLVANDRRRAGLLMRKFLGEPLIDILEKDEHNIFTVEQRIDLTIMLFERLHEQVHARSLVSRDIKPDNIMVKLDDNNNVVSVNYIDFGLAKQMGHDDSEQSPGTIGYASPEVFGMTPTSEKSDVFGLSVTCQYLWQDIDNRLAGLDSRHLLEINRLLADKRRSSGLSLFEQDRLTAQQMAEAFRVIKRERQSNVADVRHGLN